MSERFEVWVILEKGDSDDKREEIETSKVCEVSDEDDGRTMFSMVEGHAFTGRDYMTQIKWRE